MGQNHGRSINKVKKGILDKGSFEHFRAAFFIEY